MCARLTSTTGGGGVCDSYRIGSSGSVSGSSSIPGDRKARVMLYRVLHRRYKCKKGLGVSSCIISGTSL